MAKKRRYFLQHFRERGSAEVYTGVPREMWTSISAFTKGRCKFRTLGHEEYDGSFQEPFIRLLQFAHGWTKTYLKSSRRDISYSIRNESRSKPNREQRENFRSVPKWDDTFITEEGA